MEQLRSMPEVLSVQPNYIRRAIGLPNDPYWTGGQLWGLAKIRADGVWNDFTTGSSSVTVASLDTGVDYTHPDLAPNMWRNPGEIAGNGVDDDKNGYVDDVFGIDLIDANEVPGGPEDPMDDDGHGTHVAGTIAGAGNNGIGVAGVSWNSKILACKFIAAGGEGTDAGAIGCFDYIVGLKQRGENIRVSNNSWGSAAGPAPVLQWAIDAAGAAGILNVVAAGNTGTDNDATPHFPSSFSSPSIVAVAASDTGDNRAHFSNVGATTVDIAAPGTGVLSTFLNGGYATSSGTSMAAAHVAGAAALLVALDSSLTADALKTLVLNNVDVLPQWQGAVVSNGRLNLYRAAQGLGGTPPPPGAPCRVDTTTQGNWRTSYGAEAYAIQGDAINLPPAIVQVGVSASTYEWTPFTTDPRALERADPTLGRLVSGWVGNAIAFMITFMDGRSHDVAFYALDWGGGPARAQRFDVLDSTGVIASQEITGFQGGQYVVCTLSGSVQIRVVNTTPTPSSLAVVVNGIFFGGPSGPAQ
jgi:subtilisin family serine protease